jgi:sigma-B regulation protein RsbU (phosphoserine phosphatase)
MNKFSLALLVLLLSTCGSLRAQDGDTPLGSEGAIIIDRGHAQDWSSDIDGGWRTHAGDDMAWANPGFDDSGWETVRLDDLGPAQEGWRWYRLRIKLHENHPDLALLIDGGEGIYLLYVNGNQVPGRELRSAFRVNRPVERVVPIDMPGTDLQISLRTYTPASYAALHFPPFMVVALGTPDAIESQRKALESDRFYMLIPAVAFNVLFILAGIGAYSLHRSQPRHGEYQWLGLYLFLLGTADLLWYSQQAGLLPLSANLLVADPILFVITVVQIQFTFSFGGQRLSRLWRVYTAILLLAPLRAWFTWRGQFSSVGLLVTEPLLLVPAAVCLPILLFIWYRRGNREAGWLILPSLLPAATMSLYDLGYAAIIFGWENLEFLDNPIMIGPVPVQPLDIGNFLFLLAISVVIFFRFTRVSREQARTAAELSAAREIQQRLVPASLPALAGYRLEAAYMPAQEVGGDFYQVLEQPDGCTLIVVGDVSGKGLKAAMTGALAIGAVRTLAAEDLGPATLLSRLSYQMRDTQDSGFITCLCVRIGPGGSILAANAGHLSPYRGGEEIPVESGLPLGMVVGIEYSETQIHLQPGDTLTLLSDGVVEAMNPAGQLYGFDRTRHISTQSARDIADAAQAFGQEDDITVLTIARLSISAAGTASL